MANGQVLGSSSFECSKVPRQRVTKSCPRFRPRCIVSAGKQPGSGKAFKRLEMMEGLQIPVSRRRFSYCVIDLEVRTCSRFLEYEIDEGVAIVLVYLPFWLQHHRIVQPNTWLV